MKVLLLLLVLFSCTSLSKKNIRNISSSLIDESCVFINYSTEELNKISEEIKNDLGEGHKLTKTDQTNKNFLKYGFSKVSHNTIHNKNTNEAVFTNISSLFYLEHNSNLFNNLSNKLQKKICGNTLLIPNLQNTSLLNKELSPFIIATIRQMRRHNFKNKYAFVLGDSDNILSLSALKLGANKVYIFQLEEKTELQKNFPLESNAFTENDIIYINPKNKIDMANIIIGYKKNIVVVSNLGRNYEKNKGKYLTNKYSIQLASYFHNITEYILGGYRSLRKFNLSHIFYDSKALAHKEFRYNPLITRFKPKKDSFSHILSHPGEDFVAYSLSAYYKKEDKKIVDVFSNPQNKEKKKENERHSSDFIEPTKSIDQIKELLEIERGTIYEEWSGRNIYKSFLKEIKKNKKQKKFKSSLEKILKASKKTKLYFNQQIKFLLEGHKYDVYTASWDPTGRFIASGGDNDSTVRIRDTKSGQQLKTLKWQQGGVQSLSWDPTGRFIASGGSLNGTLRVWDAKSGKQLKVLELSSPWSSIHSISWDPTGRFIALGCSDKTVKIWDAKSGQQLKVLEEHQGHVYSVSWDPSGQFIASGSNDNTIVIWDAKSGQKLKLLVGHASWVRSVSWDPTGKFIASASSDHTVIIWNAKSGQQLKVLEGHQGDVHSVLWDPTGKLILSGSYDHTLRIWDAKSGQQFKILKGHQEPTFDVFWDPMGKFIGSRSWDKTIIIWKIEYK